MRRGGQQEQRVGEGDALAVRQAVAVLDGGHHRVGAAVAGEELDAALRDAGVKPGSEVEIGDELMIWQ